VRYQKFATLSDAQLNVPYLVVDPDTAVERTIGLRRNSFVRWMDQGVDLLGFLYVGFTDKPGGGHLASRILVVFQGRGGRSEFAPSDLHGVSTGTFPLQGGITATWRQKSGLPPAGVMSSASWPDPGKDVHFRVDGIGFDLATVQSVAHAIVRTS